MARAALLLLLGTAAATAVPAAPPPSLADVLHLRDANRDGVLDASELGHAGPHGTTQLPAGGGKSSYWDSKGVDIAKALRTADGRLDGGPTADGIPQQVHIAPRGKTSVVVTWVAFKRAAEPVVMVQGRPRVVSANESTYDVGVLGGWHGFIYMASIEELVSGSAYTYVVGDKRSRRFSEPKTFRWAPEGSSVRLVALGDQGTFAPAGFEVASAVERETAPDVLLHLGDLAYAGVSGQATGEEWSAVWDLYGRIMESVSSTVPTATVVGNHEQFYNFTAFRNRYWRDYANSGHSTFWSSFDFGPVHFTIMSTEHDYAPGSEQHQWLERDLANAQAMPWRIVAGHRPMYSSLNRELEQHRPGAPLQRHIEPLLLKYGVHLYLSGHMHAYERSHPVSNGQSRRAGTAPVHLVLGNGGIVLDHRHAFVSPAPPWVAVRTKRHYGFVRVFANASALSFEAVDAHTGVVLDAASL